MPTDRPGDHLRASTSAAMEADELLLHLYQLAVRYRWQRIEIVLTEDPKMVHGYAVGGFSVDRAGRGWRFTKDGAPVRARVGGKR